MGSSTIRSTSSDDLHVHGDTCVAFHFFVEVEASSVEVPELLGLERFGSLTHLTIHAAYLARKPLVSQRRYDAYSLQRNSTPLYTMLVWLRVLV